MQVDPLAPGSSLRPIQLTEPGEIREATVFSHTAGAVPTSVARRMADAAAQQLKRAVPQIANGSVKVLYQIQSDTINLKGHTLSTTAIV